MFVRLRLKSLLGTKNSSLLREFVKYGHRKFITLAQCLTRKYQTSLKIVYRDKHASLFVPAIIDEKNNKNILRSAFVKIVRIMKTRSIFNIFELLSLNSHNKLVRFSLGDTQDQGSMLEFLRP